MQLGAEARSRAARPSSSPLETFPPAIPQHPVGLSPLLVCGSAPVRPPQAATRCCRTPSRLQHCPPRTTRDPDDGFTGWGEPREVGGQAETGTKSWHRAGGRVCAAHAGFGGAGWWWCEFRAVWAAQSDWNSSFQTCPHILLLSFHPFGFCKMESKPNSTKHFPNYCRNQPWEKFWWKSFPGEHLDQSSLTPSIRQAPQKSPEAVSAQKATGATSLQLCSSFSHPRGAPDTRLTTSPGCARLCPARAAAPPSQRWHHEC